MTLPPSRGRGEAERAFGSCVDQAQALNCLLTVTQCVWPAALAVRPGAAASTALAEGPTRRPAPGVDGSASAFCSLSTPSRSAGVWRERMRGASLTASVFTGVTTALGPPPAPACSRAVCSGQVPRAGREPDARPRVSGAGFCLSVWIAATIRGRRL